MMKKKLKICFKIDILNISLFIFNCPLHGPPRHVLMIPLSLRFKPLVFIKGDNGWVVLAHKTISVPLKYTGYTCLVRAFVPTMSEFVTVVCYSTLTRSCNKL